LRAFKKLFLKKFADETTLTMLLKELGSIKMGKKEKVKYFNKKFNLILNKFPLSTQSHHSVTIGYYIDAFPANISQFMKIVGKVTLELILEKRSYLTTP